MNKNYPISQMAMIKRLSRHLKKDNQVLKKCRRGPYYRELGMFYVYDECRGRIGERGLSPSDIEDLARSLGVVAKHETVSD